MKKNIGLLLLCVFFLINSLFPQSTTGNLEGWILDEDTQPIISANVYVTSAELQGSRGTATDDHGYFRISVLPVGTYSIKISHISYRQLTVGNIILHLGQTTSLGELHLAPSTIETAEVVVSGDKPIIDTRSTSIGKNLSSEQFVDLPLERNYFHIAELLPHANLSYKSDGGTNFAGGTGVENRYFIDGSEVTGTENGILRFDLPYNFIREVEIQTGGYQAEYQSALGGVVNTITYSGGNEFHGSIFGFFTNNNFSSAPRLSAGEPPHGNYTNYDVGFGFGGPILKDQLWYYAAYDPEFTSEDVHVNGLGNQTSSNTHHKFAGKLTWSINEKNFLTLSVSGNPYSSRIVVAGNPELKVLNPEAVNRDQTSLVTNSALKGIHILNDNLMLESSLSIGIINTTLEPASPKGTEPEFVDYVNGTKSGGQGFTKMNPAQKLLNGSVNATITLPEHNIKAGVGYKQNSTKSDVVWQLIERYNDSYDVVNESVVGTVKSDNLSTFIQDSWQISPRLCLNAGMRWDPQWLIASDGTIAQKITNQVQPRIGIIYQPAELGTQKITASYGRFYEPLLLSLSVFYHIRGGIWNYTIYPNDPRIDTSGASFYPNLTGFVRNIPDLKGQYFDEFSLGYERQFSTQFKLGVRGIYRWLGQGIEDGVVSAADQEKYGSVQVYGNPGSGSLSMLPKMKREYIALELSLQRFTPTGFNFLVSYVLSRNRGNYDGFAETYDVAGGADIFPNNTNQFGLPDRLVNADGLLPNDRTHVFKFFGSYAFDFGLTTGITFQYMSGTPLNEFGVEPRFRAWTFLQPRGTVGRTPSIWDLNFRFIYDFSRIIQLGSSARLILDILHFASQRKVLDYDQYHYFDSEKNYANTNYMQPIQFQPPMSVRLGMEVNF